VNDFSAAVFGVLIICVQCRASHGVFMGAWVNSLSFSLFSLIHLVSRDSSSLPHFTITHVECLVENPNGCMKIGWFVFLSAQRDCWLFRCSAAVYGAV